MTGGGGEEEKRKHRSALRALKNGQRNTFISPPLIENRYLIEGKNVARQKTHNSLLIAMLSR